MTTTTEIHHTNITETSRIWPSPYRDGSFRWANRNGEGESASFDEAIREAEEALMADMRMVYYTGCLATGQSPSFFQDGQRIFPTIIRDERCVPLEVELDGVVYTTHPDEPINGGGCYDLRAYWPKEVKSDTVCEAEESLIFGDIIDELVSEWFEVVEDAFLAESEEDGRTTLELHLWKGFSLSDLPGNVHNLEVLAEGDDEYGRVYSLAIRK